MVCEKAVRVMRMARKSNSIFFLCKDWSSVLGHVLVQLVLLFAQRRVQDESLMKSSTHSKRFKLHNSYLEIQL